LPDIYLRSQEGALRQCEIVTGLIQVKLALATLGTDQLAIQSVSHPYAIVISQDCDLDNDWKARLSLSVTKEGNDSLLPLPSVLFAEVTTAASLKTRVPSGSKFWARVRQNKDERYQFLQAVSAESDALGEGLPELGIDFKRYFSLPTEEVYRRIKLGLTKRRCWLNTPYSHHLSARFGYYQTRVALPEDHQSAEVES
jgi:hypothetical protein